MNPIMDEQSRITLHVASTLIVEVRSHICTWWPVNSRRCDLLQLVALEPAVEGVTLTQSRMHLKLAPELPVKKVEKTAQFLYKGTGRMLIPSQSCQLKASLLSA